jgi:hypothetical protein
MWLTRESNGTTQANVAVTGTPKTTYHFFPEMRSTIRDIPTDEEGIGKQSFEFATNSVGNVYAFAMYPEGAPAGNKYKSTQVNF